MFRLRRALHQPYAGLPRQFSWDYDRAEILADAAVHVCGLGAALAGAAVLVGAVLRAGLHGPSAAGLIYAAALLIALSLSAAYNLWPISPVKWLLRRLDHSAIYLLIAATWTPFLAQVGSSLMQVGILAGVWSGALGGVSVKLLLPGRLDRASIAYCFLLGATGALALWHAPGLPGRAVVLIIAGGALYSIGVLFHLWHRLRFQNAAWHFFVLLAASCHYFAVLSCVESLA